MSAAGRATGTLTEVAADVYAYVQSPGGWCVSNAGVVPGPHGAIVVDTLATESRARRLAAHVDRLAAGPRRTVVNTHHHGDHTFGNVVFRAGAEVITHERAVAELMETGLTLTALWPDVEWGEIAVAEPTLTFADRLTLWAGERPVELIALGPAHTTNDVVVWLPDCQVLFAGDVLMAEYAPFALFGSVAGALTAIERLRRLGARTVVCGHGPVSGPEVFDSNAAYLRWIQAVAEAGAAEGWPPLRAAREVGLGDFAHLGDGERVVGNLHRAYAELAGDGEPGAPLAVGPILAEMIEFNGGELPACLA